MSRPQRRAQISLPQIEAACAGIGRLAIQRSHRICLTGAVHSSAMLTPSALQASAHDRENVLSRDGTWRVCAIALLFFVVAAIVGAMHKDVMRGFDEVAH